MLRSKKSFRILLLPLALVVLAAGGLFFLEWLHDPTPDLQAPVPPDLVQLDPQLRDYIARMVTHVDQKPGEVQRHVDLGLIYFANNLWVEASRTFLNVIQLQPNEPLAYLYLGRALEQTGKFSEAQAVFEQLTAQFSKFAPGYFHLGSLHLRMGRFPEARGAFKKLIGLQPDEWRGYAGLGEALLQEGQPEPASQALKQALHREPDARIAHHLLGLAHRATGNLAEAEKELKLGINATHTPMPDDWSDRVFQHKKSIPDQLEMANTYAGKGHFQKAEKVLHEALRWHPENARLLHRLGDLYNQAGIPEEGRRVLSQALEEDPTNLSILYALTDSCLALDQPDEAMQYAEKSIELAPQRSRSHLAKARILLSMKNYEAALQNMQTALDHDPNNAFILMDMGDVCLRGLDRPHEALKYYQKSREADGTLVPIWIRLADLRMRMGAWEEARTALNQARALDPEEPVLMNLERRLAEQTQTQ